MSPSPRSPRPEGDASTEPVLEMTGVSFVRQGRRILDGVNWSLRPGQSWVVLGPNGCGKTTLARLAALYEHPSEGSLRFSRSELGAFDVRRARTRIALVSSAMADMIRPTLTAAEVVVCARHGALEPWWHEYTEADHARARALLVAQGVGDLAGRPFGLLSSGERQRTLLARALMNDPALVLLDEPSAGLDLGGREELVVHLDALARDRASPPVVLVTHHVEEIPPSFGHLLALRQGRVLAAGPLTEMLRGELLSECFGLDVYLQRHDTPAGPRWSARGR